MMENPDPVADLLGFLSKDAPSLDIRIRATDYLAGLTGSEVGRHFLSVNCGFQLTGILYELLTDHHLDLRTNALRAVVNLSADERACDMLTDDRILSALIGFALKPPSGKVEYVESGTMALSNLAHWQKGSIKIMNYMKAQEFPVLGNLIEKFFKTTNSMHYFGSFLGNLTQVKDARLFLLDRNKMIFQKMLSFISFKDSIIRQNGIVSAIKNCCFETDSHLWMLGDKVNILPALLLPLAGPEEFDDEDTDKLPVDLQYLGQDKQREADPNIRQMLIEALNQLVATKQGRQIVKDQNAYVILRELHKWEKNEDCMVALENLISVLISDEPEHGMENLNEVKIPKDLEQKLNKNVQK